MNNHFEDNKSQPEQLEVGDLMEFVRINEGKHLLDKEIIYRCRKAIQTGYLPSQVLYMILDYLKKRKDEVPENEKHEYSIRLHWRMMGICSVIFGPKMLILKPVGGWYALGLGMESDDDMDDFLSPLIDEFRPQWEPLTKKYEEELMTLDNSC